MTIALILLIVSVSLLSFFIYLKLPALYHLPEKESVRVIPIIKEKSSHFVKKLQKKFSLHNILRKLLLAVRSFSFKVEEIIVRWIHKVRK